MLTNIIERFCLHPFNNYLYWFLCLQFGYLCDFLSLIDLLAGWYSFYTILYTKAIQFYEKRFSSFQLLYIIWIFGGSGWLRVILGLISIDSGPVKKYLRDVFNTKIIFVIFLTSFDFLFLCYFKDNSIAFYRRHHCLRFSLIQYFVGFNNTHLCLSRPLKDTCILNILMICYMLWDKKQSLYYLLTLRPEIFLKICVNIWLSFKCIPEVMKNLYLQN